MGLERVPREKAQDYTEVKEDNRRRKDLKCMESIYQYKDLQLLQRSDQLQRKVSHPVNKLTNLFRGDPMQLLKSINPAEAGLLDAASRCHIRFRLGGERFPPLIYYKIFTHGGIVDINAFAPRDYMKMKRDLKKDEIHITFDKPENDNFDGWYQRIERNGWRPISDKVLTP